MFTGLVQAKGVVIAAQDGRFELDCPWTPESIALGASIACDGCCLTATSVQASSLGARFTVDVSLETLSKTTLGSWKPARTINLERSLRAGDELGGHLVSGHVDGVATIETVTPAGFSKVISVRAPDALAKYVAPKGSVALDGVSLTVNEVYGAVFTLNLIPATLEATSWGARKPGDSVNMEVDLIARYVARLLNQ
jgi:riboflavin synthase